MKNRKGQAAMEFLMTYGWAILAAVIVVGVLWYMIGNPANLAGDDFQMSAPFVANAMSISNESIQLEVRNGGSERVEIQNITLDSGGCSGISAMQNITAGSLSDPPFTIACGGLTEGDRFNADVTLRYTTPGSSVVQKATGSIRGVVPEGNP